MSFICPDPDCPFWEAKHSHAGPSLQERLTALELKIDGAKAPADPATFPGLTDRLSKLEEDRSKFDSKVAIRSYISLNDRIANLEAKAKLDQTYAEYNGSAHAIFAKRLNALDEKVANWTGQLEGSLPPWSKGLVAILDRLAAVETKVGFLDLKSEVPGCTDSHYVAITNLRNQLTAIAEKVDALFGKKQPALKLPPVWTSSSTSTPQAVAEVSTGLQQSADPHSNCFCLNPHPSGTPCSPKKRITPEQLYYIVTAQPNVFHWAGASIEFKKSLQAKCDRINALIFGKDTK